MRPAALLVFLSSAALLGAPACSWFTDFDSLSEPGPPGGADAGSDGPATSDGDSVSPDGAPFEGGTPDALAPTVLFADNFDDATALPRAWDRASGGPSIVAIADAPSQPNALLVFSPKSAPVAPFLEKKLSTNGPSAVTFSFRMKEIDYAGGAQYTMVATASLPDRRYCALARHLEENKMYCQINGVEKSAYANVAPGPWVELKMRWSATGRIDVFGGLANDFVQYTPEELGSLESPTFQVGLPEGAVDIDWKAYVDDVKIERE